MLHFDCRFQYAAGFSLDLKFEVGSGVTALVGPSGSGKTTTLHLIAGLLQPSQGEIVLGDHRLFDARQSINVPPESRRVGLVFQDYKLFPHLSVETNLRYGMRRVHAPRYDFDHAVDVLELRPLLQRYPSQLSGGQRQRVALGRAVLRSPEILLLDEPLSAVDFDFRENAIQWLKRLLAEYPLPTLLVTHDQASAQSLADQYVAIPR